MSVLLPRCAIAMCALSVMAEGCSTSQNGKFERPSDRQAAESWAANGWLTPDPSGEPEIIGLYRTRKECEAAVDGWKARQVVGNPVFGICLPIDNR